ncbi:MAG: hypothetical protein IKQ94_10750 [Bacteroidales bacterium]|nr:hypothetical protein [Bacteroidales bacterium]
MDNNKFKAANIGNTARSAAMNIVSQAVRINLYKANFSSNLKTYERRPRLIPEDYGREDSQVENIVILKDPENGLTAEIYGAKLKITRTNDIKTTPLINRAGTVKEFIQRSDYSLEIKGNLITDATDHFPLDELKQLQAIFSEDKEYNILNVLANSFDISSVVLKQAIFKQDEQKYINVLPFELTFNSDEEYNFLIEEE